MSVWTIITCFFCSSESILIKRKLINLSVNNLFYKFIDYSDHAVEYERKENDRFSESMVVFCRCLDGLLQKIMHGDEMNGC